MALQLNQTILVPLRDVCSVYGMRIPVSLSDTGMRWMRVRGLKRTASNPSPLCGGSRGYGCVTAVWGKARANVEHCVDAEDKRKLLFQRVAMGCIPPQSGDVTLALGF